MNLRRTAVLAAVLFAASAAATPSMSATAASARTEHSAHREWVCVVTNHAPDRETTLRLPNVLVDRLVEHTRSYHGPCAEYGERATLGDGELIAYSQAV